MLTEAEMLSLLKADLTEHRFVHTLGVRDTSVTLAKLHGADGYICRIAATLHDCAKYMNKSQMLEMIDRYGIALYPGESENAELLHAPAGAAPFGTGGCRAKKDCPYNAEQLYIKDPFYKAKFIKYMKRTLTGKAKNSRRDIENALAAGDYGRCVFMCDNDVCDNQLVTMTFENGASAVLDACLIPCT